FLMYGLTEAFRSTYLPPDELDRRPTSIGKAIPDTEILVINEQGQLCLPGEVGELVHHGPTVSAGYWGQPELTDRVLRPHPFPLPGVVHSPRVCYSGDLVRADEDGFLYFVSRRDNQIKTSGFRVSPGEVEEVLQAARGVSLAAVIGVDDALLGQRIEAYVVMREGIRFSEDELRDHCAAQLPSYMVPKRFCLRDELPRTTSGKINYPALRAEHRGSTDSNKPQQP
ncbi:MAG: AMP-binding protein, partial [Planctomycetales bacterium]|nr:AMP-binding protein [Planctomycetales bacterium]